MRTSRSEVPARASAIAPQTPATTPPATTEGVSEAPKSKPPTNETAIQTSGRFTRSSFHDPPGVFGLTQFSPARE